MYTWTRKRLAGMMLILCPGLAAGFDAADYQVIDLTHAYDGDTVYWPTDTSGFRLERLHFGDTPGGFFYAANSFCTAEHGGTHMDAPVHFAEDGWTAAQIPVENLLGNAYVIDVTTRAGRDPDYRLQVEDVLAFETRHGVIPRRAIVLLRTGWSARWPDRKAYLGDDTPGDASHLHFPSYGIEAARLLVEERGVMLLGVDTASIDHGPSRDFPVHRLAGAGNVPGLENLAGLERLPATGATLVALPMKIAGGSGGPVRVVALVPNHPGAAP